MRSPRATFLVLAAAMHCASALNAAAPPQYPEYPELIELGDAILWPSVLGSGAFGRTEPIRFEGQPGRGLILSWGTKLVYAYAPMTHQAIVDSGIDASAFTVLRNPDMLAGDTLVVATSSGLSSYTYDLETGTFSGQAASGTSALADAVLLTAGDFDGDDDLDVAGIASDGTTLKVLYGNGAGSFSAGSTRSLTATACRLQALQWETTGQPGMEIAVTTHAGTLVFAETGPPLFAAASPHPSPRMAVIRPYGSATEDRLVVVQRNADDTADLLAVFASDGNESAISLGDLDVVGLDAGDHDNDGDDDLCVSHRASHELNLYANRSNPGGYGTSFSTDPHWSTAVRIGEDPDAAFAANTADPVLEDMNEDGKADILIGVEDQTVSSYETWLFAKATGTRVQGGFPDEEEVPAPFQNCVFYVGEDLGDLYGSELIDETKIAADIEIVNVWGDLSQGADNVYIEVTVWNQPVGEYETVDDEALYHALYQAPDSEFHDFLANIYDVENTLRIGFSVDVAHLDPEVDPETFVPVTTKFYVEARPVRLVEGQPTSPLRTVVSSVTAVTDDMVTAQSPGWLSVQDMENNPGALEPTQEVSASFAAWQLQPPDSGGYFGGLVIQQRVPTTVGLPSVPQSVNSEGQSPP